MRRLLAVLVAGVLLAALALDAFAQFYSGPGMGRGGGMSPYHPAADAGDSG